MSMMMITPDYPSRGYSNLANFQPHAYTHVEKNDFLNRDFVGIPKENLPRTLAARLAYGRQSNVFPRI